MTMLLTSLLMFLAMREVWHWSLALTILVAGLFIIVDLSFVAANMMKVAQGGWVPLVVGACLFFAMLTWWQGRGAGYATLDTCRGGFQTRPYLPRDLCARHGSCVSRAPTLPASPPRSVSDRCCRPWSC